MQAKPLVVAVDDDRAILGLLEAVTDGLGAAFSGFDSLTALREGLTTLEPRVVIVDGLLPDGSGVDFIAEESQRRDASFVFLSRFFDHDEARSTLRAAGASLILQKPIAPEELADYLAPLIGGEDQEFSRLRDELVIDYTMRLSERAHELEQLWGESTWDEFKVQIHKLAGSALSYGHDAISEHAGAIDRAWPERDPRAFEHLLALMRGVEEPDETAAPEGIIGDSVAMREVYRRVRLAAKSEVTVLLTGASGTGKELVARAIHSSSSRAAGPLIEVNCSAIPETLLESELFGHAKGAFTGAGRDKSGLLEAASGGTLFLDEIEDISLAMQVKLLRALEQRTIRRVGETQVRPIDTRIVAATNKDLEELVENGRIRDDFYYRVRVFDIRLPDLTDRSGDIPMLVQHFVTRFAQEQHRIAPTVSSAAMQRLLAYPWPGNVRELRNAIEHAFVVAGREIGLDALPPTLQREAEPAPEPATNAPNPADEREHIIAVLREVNGHRERAAEKLGYSRVTLWKKIKKYGLQS